LVWKKLNLPQQKHAFTNKRNVLQHKINTNKLEPGLVAFYDIWPVNGTGLFSKEKIKEISKEKVKKNHKWGSIQYKQANKYTAPKSKIESRAHYTVEPAQGKQAKVATDGQLNGHDSLQYLPC